jgi:hypothetical protein
MVAPSLSPDQALVIVLDDRVARITEFGREVCEQLIEVFLTIDGERYYLWRAVDQDGGWAAVIAAMRQQWGELRQMPSGSASPLGNPALPDARAVCTSSWAHNHQGGGSSCPHGLRVCGDAGAHR